MDKLKPSLNMRPAPDKNYSHYKKTKKQYYNLVKNIIKKIENVLLKGFIHTQKIAKIKFERGPRSIEKNTVKN